MFHTDPHITSSTSPTQTPASSTPTNNPNTKKWLLGGVTLLVVTGGVALGYDFLRRGNEENSQPTLRGSNTSSPTLTPTSSFEPISSQPSPSPSSESPSVSLPLPTPGELYTLAQNIYEVAKPFAERLIRDNPDLPPTEWYPRHIRTLAELTRAGAPTDPAVRQLYHSLLIHLISNQGPNGMFPFPINKLNLEFNSAVEDLGVACKATNTTCIDSSGKYITQLPTEAKQALEDFYFDQSNAVEAVAEYHNSLLEYPEQMAESLSNQMILDSIQSGIQFLADGPNQHAGNDGVNMIALAIYQMCQQYELINDSDGTIQNKILAMYNSGVLPHLNKEGIPVIDHEAQPEYFPFILKATIGIKTLIDKGIITIDDIDLSSQGITFDTLLEKQMAHMFSYTGNEFNTNASSASSTWPASVAKAFEALLKANITPPPRAIVAFQAMSQGSLETLINFSKSTEFPVGQLVKAFGITAAPIDALLKLKDGLLEDSLKVRP